MADTFIPYRKLSKRARETTLLSSAVGLLWWDQRTYMPPKALSYRAGQAAHLSGLAHRQFIAKKVGDLISACEQHGFAAGSDEAANIREWRRLYDRATKVPAPVYAIATQKSTPGMTMARPGRVNPDDRDQRTSA